MVYYRIDDPWSLPAPKFFRLAYRVAAYGGVMAARAAAEQEDEQQEAAVIRKHNAPPMASTDFRRQAMERGEQVTEVPPAVFMMQHADLFDVGKG